jgi:hypothetical protein
VNNFNSDPEGFAKGLCKDLELEDPEVPVRIKTSVVPACCDFSAC